MLASEAEITQRHLALPISEHTPGIRSHQSISSWFESPADVYEIIKILKLVGFEKAPSSATTIRHADYHCDCPLIIL